jgi:hypothetical protein
MTEKQKAKYIEYGPRIRLEGGKLSWAYLFKPNKDGYYATDILFPKGKDIPVTILGDKKEASTLAKALEPFIQKCKQEHKLGKFDPILKDGDQYAEDYPKYGDPYKGHVYLSVKSNEAPRVVDYDPHVYLHDRNALQSGDFANVAIQLALFEYAGRKGFSKFFSTVQKKAVGDRVAPQADPEDDFEVAESPEAAGVQGSEDDQMSALIGG